MGPHASLDRIEASEGSHGVMARSAAGRRKGRKLTGSQEVTIAGGGGGGGGLGEY